VNPALILIPLLMLGSGEPSQGDGPKPAPCDPVITSARAATREAEALHRDALRVLRKVESMRAHQPKERTQ